MEIIPKNISDDNEKSKIAVFVQQESSKTLYILFYDDILAAAVYTETRNKTTYISCVDSTGYGRGYTKLFISGIFKTLKNLIFCFTQPKNEPIFNKSSKNTLKRILSSKKLFKFWTDIFKGRCDSHFADGTAKNCQFMTWSNFDIRRSYPFHNLNEIELFDDEPTSKMISKIKNLKLLFEGLLVRSDFTKGGLIYSICNRVNLSYPKNKYISDEYCEASSQNISVKIDYHNIIDMIYLKIKEYNHNCLGSIDDKLITLRKMDFSNINSIIKSSKKFVSKFKINSDHFFTNKLEQNSTSEIIENIPQINVKKIKY